jgi:hypothetical protein|tara:strand:- start:432 stop:989 length:558 start_codon:yes stop_codon:yes gene_type:complete
MATTLEVIRGIAQAAANAYDGAHDKKYSYDGEERKIGLHREEGDVITDSRSMDGFNVRISGDRLIISYQYDCKLQHVHENGFEDDINEKVANVAKYLRSEYKKVTGSGLTISKEGECDVMVEYISRIRTSVRACQMYKIGGMSAVDGPEAGRERDVDSSIRDWLSIGKDKYPGAKKPSNVTRKND